MRPSLYRTRYRRDSQKAPDAYIRILNVAGTREESLPHVLYIDGHSLRIPSPSQMVGDYEGVSSGRKTLKISLGSQEIGGVLNLDPGHYYTLAIYPLSKRLRRSLLRSDPSRSLSSSQEWSHDRLGVLLYRDRLECAAPSHVHLRFLNLSSIEHVDVYLSGQLLFDGIPVGKIYRAGEAIVRSTIHPLRVEIMRRFPSSTVLEEMEIELREHYNYTLIFFGTEKTPEMVVLRNGEGVCRNAF
jgi:hypothetical protein